MRRIHPSPRAVILITVWLAFVVFLTAGNASAGVSQSTGPHTFASIVDDPTVGTVAWSNPSNATACDDQRTETEVSAGIISHWLKATNAGLAIPSTVNITSIDIVLEGQASGYVGDLSGLRLMLLRAGTPIVLQGLAIAPSAVDVSYALTIPSPWAQLWTPADVNASDFGAQLYAHTSGNLVVSIDCLSTNIHYSPGMGDPLLFLPLVMRP